MTPWLDLADRRDLLNADQPNVDNGSQLYVYGTDGRLVTTVTLPRYMQPRHAVMTTRGTYIVCYLDVGIRQGQVRSTEPSLAQLPTTSVVRVSSVGVFESSTAFERYGRQMGARPD